MTRNQVLIGLIAILASAASHPLCLDDSFPSMENLASLTFCTALQDPSNTDGSCCNATQETQLIASLYDTVKLSTKCAPLHAQVTCGECNPYAVHLFASGTGTVIMCPDFCADYYAACVNDLDLPDDYCDVMSADDFYCYPMEHSLSGTTELTPYFPNLAGKLPTVPIGMFMKPNDNVWWYVSQAGYIVEIANDPAAEDMTTVLDIDSNVLTNGELGLLGFAFSPDYATSKVFYVYYTDNGMNSILSRFTDMGSVNLTRNTEQRLIQFAQPYTNHQGGTILFEPGAIQDPEGQEYFDLYLSTGDGGSANDPGNRSQSLDTYFGKILRIRLSTDYSTASYTNPPGNIQNEVYAYGLRNPWKCSFHRTKVDSPSLWCGDVGQDYIEEIDYIVEGGNYGWRNFEGTRYNMGSADLDYEAPVFEYCHNNDLLAQCVGKTFTGQSITGGYWYTGSRQFDIYGKKYIFADYQSGSIHYMYKYGGEYFAEKIMDTGFYISSLAEDSDGEIYIIRYDLAPMIYQLPDLPANFQPGTPFEPEGTLIPETPHPTDSLSPTSTPYEIDLDCPNNGIKNGNICCAFECGACGGDDINCGWLNGGAGRCCVDTIAASNLYCDVIMNPPCILQQL